MTASLEVTSRGRGISECPSISAPWSWRHEHTPRVTTAGTGTAGTRTVSPHPLGHLWSSVEPAEVTCVPTQKKALPVRRKAKLTEGAGRPFTCVSQGWTWVGLGRASWTLGSNQSFASSSVRGHDRVRVWAGHLHSRLEARADSETRPPEV